jgi:hypothetical protein
MKSSLLINSLMIAVSSALAAPNEPTAPSTPAPPAKPPTVSASSHVTVTIESGGKKETHEIDLGNTPTLKIDGPIKLEGGADAPHRGDAGTLMVTSAAKYLSNIVSGGTVLLNSGPAPWLGVTVDEVSEELRAQLPIERGAGLVVRSVVPDGPAAQAGLQIHDVLVRLDDQLLVNGNQLSALVLMKKDGDKARLTYFRGGKSSTTEAQIRMRQEAYTGSTTFSGVTLQPERTAEMVVVDKDGHVLVSRTPPDLSAVTAKVEKILRAAGVEEKTIGETERTIEEAAKAAGSAVSSIESAGGDAASQIKNAADQVAKSLEKARAAAEQARKKAEEARERVEKQLEKRGDQTKAPAAPESKAPAAQ